MNEGLRKIACVLSNMRHDLRVANAKEKLVRMQRLKGAIELFEDIEISEIFRIPMQKRFDAVVSLNRAISDQKKHIEWLERESAEIRTTPEQDASIDALYVAQRKDAEDLGILTFVGD